MQEEVRKSNALQKLLEKSNKAEIYDSSRKYKGGTNSRVVIRNNTKKRKKPQMFTQTIQYDFLQYIRIIFKWALENHDLSRGELELLLYLNPIGTFGKQEFDFFYKLVSLYQHKGLQKLIDKGWITVWRVKKKDERALYTLSHKAKLLCNRMHLMCLGEEKIPETRNNKIFTDTSKVINKYYINVIKQFNDNKKASE